ncbi:hypothetical protein EI94DRAFT_1723838 [Lactarius quietus]|nr:hypothetical protein EI94DRAFT_1723838 [Lactarius quietus]
MKTPQGKVVALDFDATCFLPPSFFAFAMAAGEDNFTRLVASMSNIQNRRISMRCCVPPTTWSRLAQTILVNRGISFHVDRSQGWTGVPCELKPKRN